MSLADSDMGLSPLPALIGSPEWWHATEDGTLPREHVSGTISQVYWGSMADYPECKVVSADGSKSTWHREGDHSRYVEGLHVDIAFVRHPWKSPDQHGLGKTSRITLTVDIEISDLRSDPRAPGLGNVGLRAQEEFVTLWRPVGSAEMDLIRKTAMRAFPLRLPEQPIFYPVLSEEYAIKIARDWNVPASGQGFVTRFNVSKRFLDRYEVQNAGGRRYQEYWIPADELDAFNAAIMGYIRIIAEFP